MAFKQLKKPGGKNLITRELVFDKYFVVFLGLTILQNDGFCSRTSVVTVQTVVAWTVSEGQYSSVHLC